MSDRLETYEEESIYQCIECGEVYTEEECCPECGSCLARIYSEDEETKELNF